MVVARIAARLFALVALAAVAVGVYLIVHSGLSTHASTVKSTTQLLSGPHAPPRHRRTPRFYVVKQWRHAERDLDPDSRLDLPAHPAQPESLPQQPADRSAVEAAAVSRRRPPWPAAGSGSVRPRRGRDAADLRGGGAGRRRHSRRRAPHRCPGSRSGRRRCTRPRTGQTLYADRAQDELADRQHDQADDRADHARARPQPRHGVHAEQLRAGGDRLPDRPRSRGADVRP